ncbi:MAG: glycosyltransferase [Bacteroidales bacterium]|nr:glycosyltransferase [Bacteroidales bacterium]
MKNSSTTIYYVGNMLSSHGLSVTTIETLGKQLESCGYHFIYASTKKPMYARLMNMVVTLLKNRKRVDKILIDTYNSKAYWYCYTISMLSRLFKIPYFPILHGGGLPQRIKNRPLTSKQVFKNSALNISPSKFLQAAFKEHGYEAIYIPNNIDIKQYVFNERKKCDAKLLFVRSFDKIYNPTLAIKVLANLKKTYPQATLCMVGPDKDGSLETCRKLAKQLQVDESVKFTGKLSKKEWHQLSEEYSIFINTTNFDNMPVSIIEALALGIPVVSTNAGGLPYLLDDQKDAIIVEKCDVEQMTNGIQTLISDSSKANLLSINGRKKAESFDWTCVKQQWEQIL